MSDDTQTQKLAERKYMARMMAVQALYSQEVLGDETKKWDFDSLNEDLIQYFHQYARGHKSDKKIDKTFFKNLTQGTSSSKKQLNEKIICEFDADWNESRIGVLLMSILQAATYELTQMKTPTRVVMSEYINIADDFFDDNEVNFVNAVLDKIARKIGSDDVAQLPIRIAKEDKYKNKTPVIVRNPSTKNIIPVKAPKLSLKPETCPNSPE